MKQEFLAVSEDDKRVDNVDLQSLNTEYYQNTGATDAHGKPIYFGSLIEVPGDQQVYQVVWKLGSLRIGVMHKDSKETHNVSRINLSRCKIVGHVSDPVQTDYPKVCMELLNQLKLTDEIVDIIRSTFCVAGPVVLEMGSEGLRVINGTGSYKALAIKLAAYLHYPRHSDFKFGRMGCVRWLIDIFHTAGGWESIERTKESKGIEFLRIDGVGVWQVKADGQEMNLYELCDFILEVIGVQCG